jgi:NADPH:quinone reductase-like Zn-dependent oxidoreductase
MLIRISHAALNPGGSLMMQLLPPIFRTKPCIPELDFSGHVVQVGRGVSPDSPSSCSPGAAVFGSILVGAHVRGSGALADYVVADTAADKPSVLCLPIRDESSFSLEQAAGLCVAGSTAIDLIESAKMEHGMHVLVNGAGGGIGSLVVQMVRNAIGDAGHVVAVSSAGNEKLVRDLGADEVDIKPQLTVSSCRAVFNP